MIKKYFLFPLILSVLTLRSVNAFGLESYYYIKAFPVLKSSWNFQTPKGIAIDSEGFIYIVDSDNDRIKKLNSEGKLITQWGTMGSSTGEFTRPYGITADRKGFIYVADADNRRIQKFDNNGNTITVWGTDRFQYPTGLALDSEGNVYVSDAVQNCIYKYSDTGTFFYKWGEPGTGIGQFDRPYAIATDSNNFVYVADYGNNRIQKFSKDGEYLKEWGNSVPEGQFARPLAIASDDKGFIYVTEHNNHRVWKFDVEGNYISSWGNYGSETGNFYEPLGIAVNDDGIIHVSDTNNERIQKFSEDGIFMSSFGRGEMDSPEGIAIDSNGNIYGADTGNNRIMKFDIELNLISHWGEKGFENGSFNSPRRIASDDDGFVYVADTMNHRVQKFDTDGRFISKWGQYGTKKGDFNLPIGIAVKGESVYVADKGNHRIQIFDIDGNYISQFGSEGSGDENFKWPEGVAVNQNGEIYVADTVNDCIKKFSNGQFVRKWGEYGEAENRFDSPTSISIDSNGFIYVSDSNNHRIQKFKEENGELILLAVIGEAGSNPGQLKYPGSLAVYGDEVYVADNYNHRIQVFKKKEDDLNTKAIIVAGGGPYPGNRLWDATRLSANFAYYSLIYQGLQKADICYLSSDAGIDLDNNGKADDIVSFTDCSTSAKDCLKNKITTWASDADRLILYLVDHGGENRFSLMADEILTADELNGWLDVFQNENEKEVIVIYDACQSGSFQPILRQDSQTPPADCPLEIKPRIIISSAAKDQSAYFLNQGTISFSEFFWSEVFNGADLETANKKAETLISHVTSAQSPAYSACGSLKDKKDVKIGNGTQYFSDQSDSVIESPEIIGEQVRVKVNLATEISRVWVVLIPKNVTDTEDSNVIKFLSDSTIIGYPSQELQPSDDCEASAENQKCYSATLSFNEIGSEDRIAFFATDVKGNTFSSAESDFSGVQEIKSRALLICSDDLPDEVRTGAESNILSACEALTFQGFNQTNIEHIIPADIKQDCIQDVNVPNIANLIEYFQNIPNSENLIIYMTGKGSQEGFHINSEEILTEAKMDEMLDEVQSRISGNLILIYDADYSGSFIPYMQPPEEKNRILISTVSEEQKLPLIEGIDISFSAFFWKNIRNGMTVWKAFSQAKESLRFMERSVTPQLDDNGNGIANETSDGNRSANISIGAGIGIVPNSLSFIFPETAEADAFEADNSTGQAEVFTVDDTGQYRTLYPEGDEDWVKFYCLADEIYSVSVKNQNGIPISDIKIEIFAEDNPSPSFSGNGEMNNIQHSEDTACYVKISTENPGIYQYFLEIYKPEAPILSVYVSGTVKDISGNIISGALIKTDKGSSAVSRSGSGNYLMLTMPGSGFLFTVSAKGYMEKTFYADIPETDFLTLEDIILTPVPPPPVADRIPTAKIISPAADSRSITEGDSIDFQGYVTGGDSPLAYTWDFGGGADVRYMENPGEVFFHQTGSYIVTFTVRDADGDMSKDSLEITVKEITPEPVDPGQEDNNNNSDESDQGNAGDTDEDDSTGDAGDTDENDSNSDPSANPQTDPDPEIPEPNTDIFCPPLLFEPQDTETDISLTPDFVIGFEGDGEESISYPQIHWQISSDENFTYPEFDEISDFAEFFTPDVSLAPETMYFWRVKCLGSEGEAQWSDVWSFTTVSEDSEPTLNPPSDPTETDDEIIRDDDSETPEEFERPFEKSSLGDAGGMGCFIDVLKEMQ